MRRILPYLIASITRNNRQIVFYGVDFQWSSKSWTHNLFRLFELLFGRKYGPNGIGDTIRFESAVTKSLSGEYVQVFGTFESLVAFGETAIRAWIGKWELSWKIVPVPLMLLPDGTQIPLYNSPFRFAIAFDATAQSSRSAASTESYTHTCTGSNLLLVSAIYSENGAASNDVNSVPTYNSAASTVVAASFQSGQYGSAMYYLINPSTGAHTNTVGFNNSSNHWLGGASYSGMKQSGQPDASTTNRTDGNATVSVTTIADNCWTVLCEASGRAVTASTGTTQRLNAGDGTFLGDSNGPKTPAGSTSMSTTEATGGTPGRVMASFAPAVAAVNSGFLMAATQ